MRKYLFLLAAVLFAASCADRQAGNGAADIEASIDELIPQITLEEKIAMLHAQSKFSSPGVPRLGIAELWCTDGPHGIRAEVFWDKWSQAGWTNDSCTAYPALTCLAATFNPELAREYGESIGEEARYRNKTVLLGPGVNIYRHPFGGRNFEYMGEDPYLASRMVVPYVQGVQSKGVAACVKHYALNNDEVNRHTVNVNVDDRTLYEIYLPAFKAAVTEGGAWAVMGSYNLYKDQHLCHNERMLMDILKGEWGFDGVVISDWGGAHDTFQAIRNGLDLEFGTWTDGLATGPSNVYDRYHLAGPYLEAVRSGKVGTDELDEKVRRILRLQFRTNLAEGYGHGRFTCPEHSSAARKIAGEGIVLLKNDNAVLPVRDARRILVVGENAIKMMTIGGGSSSLKSKYEISPLDAVKARFADAEVVYERGYVGEAAGSQDGLRARVLTENRSASQLIADAVAAAKDADYVLVFGGLNKAQHQDCEGVDREQYGLPYGQDELLEALAAANDKVVFVNVSGNAVAMPWIDKVPSVLQAWYLGSEAGNAIADVLSGDVNPSGKLPFTFPVAMEDGPVFTEEQYPGIWREEENVIDEYYTEGVMVGYRWYDTKNVRPLFAFGHGLSYTSFEYGEAHIDGRRNLTVSVKNTGSVPGAEVVQLYISDTEASVERPSKELKGFCKVFLQPGESRIVKFNIPEEALSFFDADAHKWVAEPGEFVAHVGSASDDIRTSVHFNYR